MIRDLAHIVDSENARIAEPRRRNDPCPCGSGRRYKHCHGSKVETTNDPVPHDMQNANDDFFNEAENVVTAFEGGPVPISAQRLNIRRGLLRTWIVISVIWILFVGISYRTQLSEIFVAVEPPADLGAVALSPGPYACWATRHPENPYAFMSGPTGPNSLVDAWRECVAYKMRIPMNALAPPVALLIFGYVAAWVIRGFR
jgi:hypothetical protein